MLRGNDGNSVNKESVGRVFFIQSLPFLSDIIFISGKYSSLFCVLRIFFNHILIKAKKNALNYFA